MGSKNKIFIGASGWQYRHWQGIFYPRDLTQKDWLKFYSKHFNSVEVNSSFYRQTKATTFEKWRSEVPKGFTFSIKGNRYITHIKRLRDCKKPLKIFFENTIPFTRHHPPSTKHVILWQMPPSLKKDIKRLKDFLGILSNTGSLFRHAFEFRNKSWIDRKTFVTVIQSTVAGTVVFQDWREWPSAEEYAGLFGGFEELVKNLPFVYLRFHGKDKLYTSCYSEEELANWAEKMQEWIRSGKDVYAYFNNDALGYAVANALRLKELTQSK